MNFSFKTLKQIETIFEENKELWATEISEILWKSRVTVHKCLKELVERWVLKKVWKWSRVKYLKIGNDSKIKKETEIDDNDIEFSFEEMKILEESFLKFSPDWKIMKWFYWFKTWCRERNLDIRKKLEFFIKIYKHILSLQDSCWLINAKNAFFTGFEKVYLDNVFYSDQYNWMEFWRWKLAELTFYWKSTQNKELINQSIDEIILKLECKIKQNKYDAIAIIPWSINRKYQLLKILQNRLKLLNLPFVNIIKYSPNWIIIPQKSLKTREQRIKNAKNTIFINDKNILNYKKVFLIDDFVWSGATLNETAKKLKEAWIKEIDWFSFVGNLNLKYDIINEV